LLAALAAYDEALLYRRPDTAPLDYAMTQGNLANLFLAFASLPEEDRRTYLLKALRCAYTALSFFEQIGHAPYAQQAARQLRQISEEAGELFLALWTELNVGQPPEWLTAPAPDDALLQAIADFINAPSLAQMRTVAEANPVLSAEQVEPVFASLLQQYQGNEEAVAQITQRRDLLRACREQGVKAVFDALEGAQSGAAQLAALPEALRVAFVAYLEARQRAEQEKTAEAWQAAARLGNDLLAHPDASRLPIPDDQLREQAASDWNQLGYILSDELKKPADALAAFAEAIRLQPEEAMYHRNHASTNVELGNFDAAEADLARAAELEPDHPRLADLRRELEEARKGQHPG